MAIDSIKEISKITTIPESNLKSIAEWLECCIAHNIYIHNKDEFPNIIDVDIKIGVLSITINQEDVAYRFTPSANFEQDILNAVDGIDILAKTLEKKLSDRLLKIYKEI